MRRTRPTQRDCYACREWNYKWFANDLEEPYTNAGRQAVQLAGPHARRRRAHQRLGPAVLPAQRTGSARASRSTGTARTGRSPTRISCRYYELVEDYVGISGQAENVPELPDSRFHPAMPMSCAETQLRTRVKSKLGLDGDHRPRGQHHASRSTAAPRATTAGRASTAA